MVIKVFYKGHQGCHTFDNVVNVECLSGFFHISFKDGTQIWIPSSDIARVDA